MTPPDITRLPKWAREYIGELERRRDYWWAEAHAIGGDAETNTAIYGYPNVTKLPNNARILFGNNREEQVIVYWDDEMGAVNLSSKDGSRISIFPIISNVINVRTSR